MIALYLDIEYYPHESPFDPKGKVFLAGFFAPSTGYKALYGKSLSESGITDVLGEFRPSYLVCWGPDIGRLENTFNLSLKPEYRCVNLETACKRLGYSGKLAGALRELSVPLKKPLLLNEEMNGWEAAYLWSIWESRKSTLIRDFVLDYNRVDCKALWEIAKKLKTLRQMRMPELYRLAPLQ